MATGRLKWSTSRSNNSESYDAWLPSVHKHQINVQRNDFGNATHYNLFTYSLGIQSFNQVMKGLGSLRVSVCINVCHCHAW